MKNDVIPRGRYVQLLHLNHHEICPLIQNQSSQISSPSELELEVSMLSSVAQSSCKLASNCFKLVVSTVRHTITTTSYAIHSKIKRRFHAYLWLWRALRRPLKPIGFRVRFWLSKVRRLLCLANPAAFIMKMSEIRRMSKFLATVIATPSFAGHFANQVHCNISEVVILDQQTLHMLEPSCQQLLRGQ